MALVGCSVARVQAVNTLTLLLVWAILEQSVIQIRDSWSNIMRVSLGIGAWLSVNIGELVTRSAKFASIALSSFAVDSGFVGRKLLVVMSHVFIVLVTVIYRREGALSAETESVGGCNHSED